MSSDIPFHSTSGETLDPLLLYHMIEDTYLEACFMINTTISIDSFSDKDLACTDNAIHDDFGGE